MTQISNCGHDERGKYSGGTPGDQGGEYTIRNWYSRPWKCVLRYPEKAVADEIADVSRKAALNQNIGYCQAHRRTYYEALKIAPNWDPSKVTKAVEGDCSSTTTANVIAAGHRTGKTALQRLNPDIYTGNMRAAFKAVGFEVLTGTKYTDSSDYLLPGDILLNDQHHVAVNVTAGAKSAAEASGSQSSGSGSSASAADNASTIWSYLKKKGFSDIAAAGIIGNLYAESALNPKNLQNSFEKKLGMTDTSYTVAVDNGSYSNFDRDGAGYGLAQWTYWTRKQQLKELAAKKKASIGDLNVQLEYLYTELTVNYAGVSAALKVAKTVREASDVFLKQFERPADQSEAVQKKRAAYGQSYFGKFGRKAETGVPSYKVGAVYETTVNLNVRTGQGTGYRKKNQNELTADGQKHAINGVLQKGTRVSCLEVTTEGSNTWIRTPSGWLAAYYDGDIYIK